MRRVILLDSSFLISPLFNIPFESLTGKGNDVTGFTFKMFTLPDYK